MTWQLCKLPRISLLAQKYRIWIFHWSKILLTYLRKLKAITEYRVVPVHPTTPTNIYSIKRHLWPCCSSLNTIRGQRGTEAFPQRKNNPLRESHHAPSIDQQLEVRNSNSPGHSTTPSVGGEGREGELHCAQLKFSQIFQLDITLMKTTNLPQRF